MQVLDLGEHRNRVSTEPHASIGLLRMLRGRDTRRSLRRWLSVAGRAEQVRCLIQTAPPALQQALVDVLTRLLAEEDDEVEARITMLGAERILPGCVQMLLAPGEQAAVEQAAAGEQAAGEAHLHENGPEPPPRKCRPKGPLALTYAPPTSPPPPSPVESLVPAGFTVSHRGQPPPLLA